MKSQNQIVMVSLAIIFAIALVLTVTLICLSSASREQSGQESTKRPSTDTRRPSLTAPPLTDDPAAITVLLPVTSTPEVTEEVGSGLRFLRNGNGTCTLVGIGTCRDAFVVIPEYSSAGDRVTSIADGALMGCSGITAVQIPKTVTDVGYLALANCPDLIYISVNAQNPYYCDVDGVLYSKDQQTLLQYPALRAGESYYLPPTVTRIADMAFYQCRYLTAIRYGGTPEQWDTLVIGSKNHSLIAASVEFCVVG